MIKGWETKTLGDLLEKTETVNPLNSPETEFEYIDVSSVSNKTFQIDSTQVIKGKNAPSRAKKLVRKGDIIFATIRPTLKRIAIVPEHLDGQVCSTGYTVLRTKERIDHRFIFYFLFTETFSDAMERLQRGASYPAVTDGDVRGQEISVPPLAEQQRIVAKLDEAFAAIAKAKENAEKNVTNARAIFESELNAIFERKGDGWVEKPLASLCDIKHGFAFDGQYFRTEGEYVLLTPGNFFEAGGYRDRGDKQKYYDGPIPNGFILDEGDMLVAMTEQAAGLLGSPIIVPESDKFLHNQRLGLVTAKDDAPWVNDFFFYVFNTKKVRKEIHASASGVKVRHTSPRKIGEVVVAFPQSTTNQEKIVIQLNSLHSETERLASIYQRKLGETHLLQESLLNHAFTGQL
jgi:type I restriction enzyme S subunit